MGLVLLMFDALLFFRYVAKMPLFAAGIILVICLVGLLVYQRLKLVRQMEQQQDNLYQVFRSRIARFRYLMRLHDYVGVGTLSLLAVVVGVVRRADWLAYLQPHQPNWGGHLDGGGRRAAAVLALLYAAYLCGRKRSTSAATAVTSTSWKPPCASCGSKAARWLKSVPAV